MSEQHNSNYLTGVVYGSLIGGAVGAITALLLAPKSGRELREDIANRSSELYGKASEYYNEVEGKVSQAASEAYSQGKEKAQGYFSSAKEQATNFIQNTGKVYQDSKAKVEQTKDLVLDIIELLREAAKASAEAFKEEMKSPLEEEEKS